MTATATYYTYDASHRMKSQYILGGEAHYYTYNERNMVASIQDVGGSADFMRYFVYNGVGERVIATDNTVHPGLPAYWSYDGRKFLQDKQLTTGSPVFSNYRHNDTDQDCPYGSMIEQGLNDATGPAYPALDGAGNVTNIQDPTDGINDSFVANASAEQIAATDNFKTRPRAFSPSGMIRGQTTQEIYFMRGGKIRIPAKNVVLGGIRGVHAKQDHGGGGAGGGGGAPPAPSPSPSPTPSPSPSPAPTPTPSPECPPPGSGEASGKSGQDDCCGPEVTTGFLESLRRLEAYMELESLINKYAGGTGLTISLHSDLLQLLAAVAYKTKDYATPDCPSAHCTDSVTICDNLCINKSELGGIAYGYAWGLMGLSKWWATELMGEARIVKNIKHLKTGMQSASDIAGMLGGFRIGRGIMNAPSPALPEPRPDAPESFGGGNGLIPKSLVPSKALLCGVLAPLAGPIQMDAPGSCKPCATELPMSSWPFILDANGRLQGQGSGWSRFWGGFSGSGDL